MVLAVKRGSNEAAIALSRTQVVGLLAMLGFVIRVALLRTRFHGYDSFAYSHWTWRLVHEPLRQFYVDDGQAFPDHLPGDLWVLRIIGQMTNAVDPNVDFYASTYTIVIACVVMVFDALAAGVIWKVGVRFADAENAASYALAYWLAPAPIFVASVWGQTDGIAAALAVIALWLGVTRRFSRSLLVLTFCALVKPQYGLLLMPLLVGWWHIDDRSRQARLTDIIRTGLGSLALVALLSAPFGVSLLGAWGDWSMLQRVQLANDLYPVSVLGAHNVWILFDPFNWPPDDRSPWLLGVSRHTLGLVMFVVVAVASLWILMRRWRSVVTMVVVANVLMLGFFLVMTRMHERYAFPVVALSILLAAMDGRYRRYAVAINALVFANIALRYMWTSDANDAWLRLANNRWVESLPVVYALVALTIWTFCWLVRDAVRKDNENSH